MTHRVGAAASRDLAERWCALAEQRLEYLTEMFESGRWRRFYSEAAFLENIKEAKFAVETWRGLSTPELTRGIAAVEFALSAPAVVAPVRARTEAGPLAIAPEPSKSIESGEHVAADTGRVEAVVDMFALSQALDIRDNALDLSAIEHRYPLLRNTL
jgi:hypothetical protein